MSLKMNNAVITNANNDGDKTINRLKKLYSAIYIVIPISVILIWSVGKNVAENMNKIKVVATIVKTNISYLSKFIPP